jgi:hypothetical protein
MIVVDIPVRIISEANSRQHWRKAAARKRVHRMTARTILQMHARPMGETEQFTITLTRVAPRKLDDDNLASGFKAVRDGVADWLGIDDGSPRIQWVYRQHKGDAGHYTAWVKVEWTKP